MDECSSANWRAYIRYESGAVVLDLNGKGLSSVPDAVTELIEVEEIRLRKNNLSALPTSINKLENLQMLDVAGNNLTHLPAEIGDLKELRLLKAGFNQFVSVPSSIQKLDKLEKLYLGNNRLKELPVEICDLKELRVLSVSNNQLVGLPQIALNKLEALNLDNNRLTELPTSVGDLKELRVLKVRNNKLVGLSSSIQKLSKLSWLYLDKNSLTELPSEIGHLKELRVLQVTYNCLVGLPTSVLKLNKLEELYLGANKLREIPTEIGNLKELRLLDISNNELVHLPTSMKKLDYLEKLYLGYNKLTALPTEIGDLTNLKEMYVRGNPFTVDAVRYVLKLEKKGMHTDISAPTEIEAQGERAQQIYQRALRHGAVKVYRGRVLLIGQDRAGKTSLKKSLIGLPFNPKESSTDGIEVDPSLFQLDVDEVKNWQPIDESKQGLLPGCSTDVAQMVVEKLCIPVSHNWEEKEGTEKDVQLDGDDSKDEKELDDTDCEKEEDSIEQVPDPKEESVSELSSSGPHHELEVDNTSPPAEIQERAVNLIRYLKGERDVTENSVGSIELWDFAGQQLYYASHPVFLTSRAICILVCNLSKSLHLTAQPRVRQGNYDVMLDNPNGETNLENLLSWLSTVHSITHMRGQTRDNAEEKLPYLCPPVIIVGTHADQPFKDIATMKSEIQRAIAGKDYEGHVVRPIFSIDNTAKLLQSKIKKVFWQDKSIDDIQALQDKIMEVLRQEPYMGEMIPVRWLNFEKVINALLSKEVHHLNIKELQSYAKEKCFIDDEEEFTTMINFYHDLGIIIKHYSTVILSAKWLIDLFGQLITIPDFNKMDPKVSKHWKEVEESGVLSIELVDHVFSKFLLKGIARDDILDMMKQFGLIAKFTSSKNDEKYFVPCQLKMPPNSLCSMVPSSSDPCPLYVYFSTGFVPHGLFTLLVSRLVSWCSEAGPTQPPTLYRNGAWFIIGRQIIHDLVLICKKQFIKFFVKQIAQDQHIKGDDTRETAIQVLEFLETTLQSLSKDLPYLRGLQYQIRVRCPYCQLEKCTGHNQMACTHEDCLHLLELRQGQPLICKRKPVSRVLTVQGQEKWFSQTISQETFSSSSGVTQRPHRECLILKVALLAIEWGSSKGGLSTVNRTLAIHLAKLSNVEVTILVPEFECSEDDKRTARSHNIAIREAEHLPGFSDPLDWLSFPPDDLDIQVVIGHGAKLGRQAQIIRKSHCCKWVQVVHTEPEELAMHKNYSGAVAKGEGKNRAEVDLCQIADLVVAVGPKLTEAFSSKLRSTHREIFQLIPGSFEEFFDIKRTTQESANFKVLAFGRGDFEDFSLKGYDIAAKAIVELKDSSYRLIFVGAPDGKQDEVADNLLQSGISRNQLIVRSFVKNKQRLKELFCEVDVAIMPSRTEGFGLTALEAMSAGLPILVSGNSGFGEALRDLPIGDSFVIDSDDPKEWAREIAAIRKKPKIQLLEDIQSLRRCYAEKFRWERQCQTLVDKMWKIVYGAGRPREHAYPVNSFEEGVSTGQLPDEPVFHALQQIQLETRTKTSKTDLSLNLKSISLDKGFLISDNQGEGNCMFLALSEQLELIKGIKISHKELRLAVVHYLKENSKLPNGTELFHFVHGCSSWEAYLASMMTDGTWGDHVVLHGAANCFETCIHVINSLPHHNDIWICPEFDVTGSNRLVLGHLHELHYVSLIPDIEWKNV